MGHVLALLVIAAVLVVVLWLVVEGAAVVGLLAALTGGEVSQCSRCHRYGVTRHGVHPGGCPHQRSAGLLHAWISLSRRSHGDRTHLGRH